MLEKEFYISRLITAYLQDSASDEEKQQLENWLEEDPKNRIYFEEICQQQLLKEKLQLFQSPDKVSVWQKTIGKIQEEDTNFFSRHKERKIYNRRFLAAVAAVFVIFFATMLYRFYIDGTPTVGNSFSSHVANDILPGGQGATLTLANGKHIRLADAQDGKLAEEYGVKITKSADGQLVYEFTDGMKGEDKENTLSTSNGETYQLKLPDGSRVWLNAGSSITYRTKLINQGKRMVKLSGEAYFEIAKDRSKPFVVKTKQQEVEVLGTHFNINAYADEPMTATTLLEGSIKVSAPGFTKIIKPGYQSLVSVNKAIVVSADIESILDWKNGDFIFNQMDFKTAMRKIARWYDVEIVYDVNISDDMITAGWISKDRPLSQVLKSIESAGMVRFKIEDKKIHVLNK